MSWHSKASRSIPASDISECCLASLRVSDQRKAIRANRPSRDYGDVHRCDSLSGGSLLHAGIACGVGFCANRRLAGALATTLVGDLWISSAQA